MFQWLARIPSWRRFRSAPDPLSLTRRQASPPGLQQDNRPLDWMQAWVGLDRQGWERGTRRAWWAGVRRLLQRTEAALADPQLLLTPAYRRGLEQLAAAHRDLLALHEEGRRPDELQLARRFYSRWLAPADDPLLPRPTRILLAWLAARQLEDQEEWHRQRERWLEDLGRRPLQGWELGPLLGEDGDPRHGPWLWHEAVRERLDRLQELLSQEGNPPVWVLPLLARADLEAPQGSWETLALRMREARAAGDEEALFEAARAWLQARDEIPAPLEEAFKAELAAVKPGAPTERVRALTSDWLALSWQTAARSGDDSLFQWTEELLTRLQRSAFVPFPSALEARLRAFTAFRGALQAWRLLRRWEPVRHEERLSWLRACCTLAADCRRSGWLRRAEREARQWWWRRVPPGAALALAESFSRCGEAERAACWWHEFCEWLAARPVSLALEMSWRADAACRAIEGVDWEGWQQQLQALARRLRRRVRVVEPASAPVPVPLEPEHALWECARGVLILARRLRRQQWVYEALDWVWSFALPEMRARLLGAGGAAWLALGEAEEGLHCFDQAWEILLQPEVEAEDARREWAQQLVEGWEAGPWRRSWEAGRQETERWRRRLWERGAA